MKDGSFAFEKHVVQTLERVEQRFDMIDERFNALLPILKTHTEALERLLDGQVKIVETLAAHPELFVAMDRRFDGIDNMLTHIDAQLDAVEEVTDDHEVQIRKLQQML